MESCTEINLNNKLSIYYENASGIRTKTCRVSAVSTNAEYDVFVITETWLNENFFDEELFDINLFHIFRKDRCS